MMSNRQVVLTLLKVADLSVMVASFGAAMVWSGGFTDMAGKRFLELRFTVQDALFAMGYLGLWRFVLASRGLYESYRLSAPSREVRDLCIAMTLATAALVPASVVLHFPPDNLLFLIAFFTIAFLSLSVERRLLRILGRWLRASGRNLRNVVIVGTGDAAVDLTAKLARREDLGYRVIEVVEVGSNGNGHRDSFTIAHRIEALIETRAVDELFVALPLDAAHAVAQSLIAVCEEQGVTVRVVAHVASLYWARAKVDEIEGQPVLTIDTGRPDAVGAFVKRLLDLSVAAVGLVLLSPVFLIVALLIKLDSTGPVLFAQERVGQNRRRFAAYKFRTMVVDAERIQATLETLNEARGPVFKIEKDPRVTRLGRWLRRSSIDEFPQLLNVLKGEMSLVGPRPLPVRDVKRIDVRWHKRRFAVKPGITCLWQVTDRRPLFDEWIRSDMEYIDNWSLSLDLKILAKTIPAVLSGQGAQ